MQNELDKVVEWLNASKTNIVIFKCENKSLDTQITTNLNNDITRSYYRKEIAASAFHISQHNNTRRAHLNQ